MTQMLTAYYAVKVAQAKKTTKKTKTNKKTKPHKLQKRGNGLEVLLFNGIFVKLNCNSFSRLH